MPAVLPYPWPTATERSDAIVEAAIADVDAARLSRAFEQRFEAEETLERLREQRYADHESVFDIAIEDALNALGETVLLPAKERRHIEGMNDTHWGMVYRESVYPYERGTWPGPSAATDLPLGADELVDAENPPDGRLSWLGALDYQRDNTRISGSILSFDPEDVSVVNATETPSIAFDLPSGDSLHVHLETDFRAMLDEPQIDSVKLFHESTALKTISGETVREQGLHVMFDSLRGNRRYADDDWQASVDDPDEHVLVGDLSRLAGLSPPFDTSALEVLTNVITRGYLTTSQMIRHALFLCGSVDVAHVRYGSAVPTLVRTLAGAYDCLLTPIPQTGDVLLHRTPFDSEVAEVLSALETAFPERRELTDQETALIGSVLGHPESAIEHRRTHNQSQTAGLTDERIAHLFDSRAINQDDVFALQFVEWLPAPTDEAVHEAIAEGTTRIESLSRFDERHDVMLARSVFAAVHECDGYARNRL